MKPRLSSDNIENFAASFEAQSHPLAPTALLPVGDLREAAVDLAREDDDECSALGGGRGGVRLAPLFITAHKLHCIFNATQNYHKTILLQGVVCQRQQLVDNV